MSGTGVLKLPLVEMKIQVYRGVTVTSGAFHCVCVEGNQKRMPIFVQSPAPEGVEVVSSGVM
jgi:hypothetical protein